MNVAIVGNMNNNGFSILRHLMDLGVNVKLFISHDDITDVSSHFSLINDTWDIDKYEDAIHYLNYSIGPGALLSISGRKLLSYLIYFYQSIRRSGTRNIWSPISTSNFNEFCLMLNQFDLIICSSVSPAIINKCSITHKTSIIFYPYAIGCEYVQSSYIRRYLFHRSRYVRKIASIIRSEQMDGLLKVDKIVTSDERTFNVCKAINSSTSIGYLPIVYYKRHSSMRKINSYGKYEKYVNRIKNIRSEGQYVYLSHSRHEWVKPEFVSDDEWMGQSKNNDWVIYAFKRLLKKYPGSVLVLFRYGKDSNKTEEIVRNLNISGSVLWFPIMPRKIIMDIFLYVDVGIGEFYNNPTSLGGAQLECMATGTPLITGVHSAIKNNIPVPPILESDSANSIFTNMCLLREKKQYSDYANLSFAWYEQHAGKGAAQNLIQNSAG